MVAVCAADQAPDVSVASALGSLLHAHVEIRDPRWRLDALARIVPALQGLDIPIHRVSAELREGVRFAVCPRPLREPLLEVLLGALDGGSPLALSGLVAALWSRSWSGALFRAVCAALALGANDTARALAGHVDLEAG